MVNEVLFYIIEIFMEFEELEIHVIAMGSE
jgi:hypothetical protein